jgi:thiamine biosynthesis lipoprotein
MNSADSGSVTVQAADGYWIGHFSAMASPCEVLIEADSRADAARLTGLAAAEAWRLERKFSRYRADSILSAINRSGGIAISVDEETALLMDYAQRCYELSGGLFDVTSGVLRSVWTFDGSDRVPSAAQVSAVLPRVGWQHVQWRRPELRLPPGMEIDLGGIGKEYAVDRALLLLRQHSAGNCVVNFGGDLATSGARRDGRPWTVGIETPGSPSRPTRVVHVSGGALATSGDTRRFLVKDGKRYSHILDPRSGWPVQGAPRSVTVAADTCTEAGTLATFAMLLGDQAERFLQQQGVAYWCLRG